MRILGGEKACRSRRYDHRADNGVRGIARGPRLHPVVARGKVEVVEQIRVEAGLGAWLRLSSLPAVQF
jgi:hypothetical protein